MKKRALSVLLAAAMVSTMLAGCSGGSSDSSSASADASATDGNVVKIGVYEPASGDNGAGGKPVSYTHLLPFSTAMPPISL